MSFLSYAQNFEDVLLWRALREVGEGFYIDVGAQDPALHSVTRGFYEKGWRGVNVEPVAAFAEALRAARPQDVVVEAALGAAPGEAPLFVVAGTGLSTTEAGARARAEAAGWSGEVVTVPVRTLAEICQAHVAGPIHFLKIDVEGSEAAVLAGADFAAFRPWIVVVEATAPLSEEPTHAGWEPGLVRAGYRFVWFDGLNRFYVAEERAALAPVLARPASVHDDFLWVQDPSRWAGEAAASAARAAGLADEVAALQRALAASQAEVAAAWAEVARSRAAAEAAQREAEVARAWVAAVRASTSWRLMGALRWAGRALGR